MDAWMYESEELLSQYLLFHYGTAAEQMPWPDGPQSGLFFPQRCVREGFVADRLGIGARALDIGCAVGAATFALAQHGAIAIGVDYSAAFIHAARDLQARGSLQFAITEVGQLTRTVRIECPRYCGEVQFRQGDAQQLDAELGSFDAVLVANLLCRLQRPQLLLDRLPTLLNPGGQLVITTPNTWLESFTDPQFWVGGTRSSGEPLAALQHYLQPQFRFECSWDMPFLIREHSRKFQWSVAQASRWVRR